LLNRLLWELENHDWHIIVGLLFQEKIKFPVWWVFLPSAEAMFESFKEFNIPGTPHA